jgi:hypothetical protein
MALARFAFELNIPIEIIAPSLRCNSETNRYVQHGRNPFGLFGAADQGHACLCRRAPSLLVVTLKATGNDIFPGLGAAGDDWDDVIECEVFRGAFLAAVLACVMVASINICPAELYVLKTLPDLYVL